MRPLISAADLIERAADPQIRFVDVRADLKDPSAGPRAYREGHLPGAVHLHLETDLSGPVTPDGSGGRHPLPDPERLAALLGERGIGDAHRVVAYDDAGGAFAARAWWLLRWLGHDAVQVLDGGLPAWTRAGGRLERTPPRHPAATFTARPGSLPTITAEALLAELADGSADPIDVRAEERYRGETEPLDPVAGHVPGARNLPFAGNLAADGTFLPPDRLRERYAGSDPARAVVYCGSGVTAAHAALAMAHAGVGVPRLYPGSWSDWCSREARPVATALRPASERAGAGDPQ